MASESAQKVVGLTNARGTALADSEVRTLTDDSDRALTPEIETPLVKRRYSKRARKCKCGCGEMVKPTAKTPNKVFASDACRKRYHRRLDAKIRETAPKNGRTLEMRRCMFCRNDFLAEKGKRAKYCCASHRVLAADRRRKAAVSAIVNVNDTTAEAAELMIENVGMKLVTSYLKQQGYLYNERDRQWEIRQLRKVKG